MDDGDAMSFFVTERTRVLQLAATQEREIRALLTKMSTVGIICRYCTYIGVEYLMKQSRSGDEGMSTYFACPGCRKSWYDR